MIKEECTLMTKEEYIEMREKAIEILSNAQAIDSKECMAGNTSILIEEKDVLLEELIERYEYLTIPVELILTSKFWRSLKVESNKRIKFLKIQ